MALSLNKFQQFVEDLAKGVHNFTSDGTCTITIALSNSAPSAAYQVLASISQISYTNCSSRVLTGVTAEHTAGVLRLDANNITLSASGTVGPFRYIILYNDDPTSPANPLIGWYDYGSNLTLSSGDSLELTISGTGILTVT